MRQAFHVFKKDARHLRLEIAIVLAAVVAFTIAVARGAQSLTDPATSQGVAATLLTYLLPVAWAVLVARLVHAEPLPGNRQFWITRPYNWKSLVAAKTLFVVAFVILPNLLADTVILRIYGFGPTSEIGGLLWSQLLLTAVLLLPAAALSTVTTSLVQMVAVILLAVLAVAGWQLLAIEGDAPAPWFGLEWTKLYSVGFVITVGALAVILWQYARRRTTASRLLGAAAALTAFAVLQWLPWPAAFAVQSRLSTESINPSEVEIEFTTDSTFARAVIGGDGTARLTIPFAVTAPRRAVIEGITAEIAAPDGVRWQTGSNPQRHVRATGVSSAAPVSGSTATFHARLDSSTYRALREAPVHVRGSVYLTLYGNPRLSTLPFQADADPVPTAGVGLCTATDEADRGTIVNCRSALRPRSALLSYGYQYRWLTEDPRERPTGLPRSLYPLSQPRQRSYSPFPAELNLVPVSQFTLHGSARFVPPNPARAAVGITMQAAEPVAYIRKEFEITGLRLADLEAER